MPIQVPKDLKHDIKQELKELKEFKETFNREKTQIIEEDITEKENGVSVNLVKNENEKHLCDVTLACDGEQTCLLKVTSNYLFHCDKCPAKFSIKNDLKKHKWTHSEITTSSCNVCKKVFNHKSKLEEHLKNEATKFSITYFDLNVLKHIGAKGRSLFPKHGQNFVFQVF